MSPAEFSIRRSNLLDLEKIFSLFDAAMAYQQKHGYELWPRFKEELIAREISEGRHYKICLGDEIACVFSVLFSDPLIWLEKDEDPALYLHRIAVNPEFKGNSFMRMIRDWALNQARERKLKYVRMDTWGNNEQLREYYIRCGFPYIGQHYQADAGNTEDNYGGPVLSLFQLEV